MGDDGTKTTTSLRRFVKWLTRGRYPRDVRVVPVPRADGGDAAERQLVDEDFALPVTRLSVAEQSALLADQDAVMGAQT